MTTLKPSKLVTAIALVLTALAGTQVAMADPVVALYALSGATVANALAPYLASIGD